MLTFFVFLSAFLGGALAVLLVYRMALPKLRDELHQSLQQWKDETTRSLDDTLAADRQSFRYEWQRHRKGTLELVVEKVQSHTTAEAAKSKVAVFQYALAEINTLGTGLTERVDRLAQETAQTLDERLEARIADMVVEAVEAHLGEAGPKLDGVQSDTPDKEGEEEKGPKQATNTWNW